MYECCQHCCRGRRGQPVSAQTIRCTLHQIGLLHGILKRKVEERKVSNIHKLRDVVMKELKRTPVATCAALLNSMPKRNMPNKAVLENNGGHTNY